MAMNTQIFDDGSTLTYDDVTGFTSATDSPYINNSSAVWSPAAVNPNATTWGDVLAQGFTRIIDAKVRPIRPENTTPILASNRGYYQALQGGAGGFADLIPWLIIGGIALVIVPKLIK